MFPGILFGSRTGVLGHASKAYGSVGDSLVFSPDSKRVAYLAGTSGKQILVVDGKEGKAYDETWGVNGEHVVFSPDGRRVAYVATSGGKRVAYWKDSGGKQFVVVDGKPGQAYDEIASVVFSPDSQHVAYGAKVGDKWVVVINGKEGQRYDNFLFYYGRGTIFDSPNSLHYLAVKGDSVYLVEETLK